MSHYNSEGQPEGEWDDRGDLSWNELDWSQFLKRQEEEVARFLRYYNQSPVSGTERLDWVARQMNWDTDDWAIGDFPEEEDEVGEEWKDDSESFDRDEDPYTLHRHPVFIVTSGLFAQLRHILRNLVETRRNRMDPLLACDFSDVLASADRHMLIALQSMDVGDYLLCVVHLKRSLKGLNTAMHLLPHLAAAAPIPEQFRRNLLARLFDIREVGIRVMMDCREEENRDFRDE